MMKQLLEGANDGEVDLWGPAARDIAVGGPTLAAQALKLGLVDECHFFLSPVIVGGGLPALPNGVHMGLELLDEDRFGNGTVHLHYRVKA